MYGPSNSDWLSMLSIVATILVAIGFGLGWLVFA